MTQEASTLFLTKADIAHLTGTKRRRNQAAWLKDHGYPFELNGAGLPIVLRSVMEKRLGGKPEPKAKEPNYAALNPTKKAA